MSGDRFYFFSKRTLVQVVPSAPSRQLGGIFLDLNAIYSRLLASEYVSYAAPSPLCSATLSQTHGNPGAAYTQPPPLLLTSTFQNNHFE